MLALTTASAAYAYGVQNHVVNGIAHGCPFDPGCTGSTNYAGDYNRRGYNQRSPAMSYSRVQTFTAGGSLVRTGACYNCISVYTSYDTNPTWECKYFTSHYATGPTLNAHTHYTESAIC